MEKILIAVDDIKNSKAILLSFHSLARLPKEVVLVHVQKFGGRSLMYEMLGEAEMKTFKESVKGTDYKKSLDRKAEKVLSFYKYALGFGGQIKVNAIVREGHPADEILKVAREENVELIILGCNKREGLERLITGSVGKEVQLGATVPVVVAKKPLMCEEAYSWRDAYAAVSVFTAVFLGLFLFGFILEKLSLLH